MTTTAPRQLAGVPVDHFNTTEWIRQIAQAVNSMLQGRRNNTGTFTLTANATTTTVTDRRVGAGSKIFLSPTTQNAGGAVSIWVSDVTKNSFTLTHASLPSTDRTFAYMVEG